jgi:hypothetical protein
LYLAMLVAVSHPNESSGYSTFLVAHSSCGVVSTPDLVSRNRIAGCMPELSTVAVPIIDIMSIRLFGARPWIRMSRSPAWRTRTVSSLRRRRSTEPRYDTGAVAALRWPMHQS